MKPERWQQLDRLFISVKEHGQSSSNWRRRRSTSHPKRLACLYIDLGEREKAFASLEKAYAAHDLQLQYLGTEPDLDPLRSDPRFADLMRRVGLTP